MKELLTQQRDTAARLGITQTKEIPGNIAGFSAFYDSGVWTPTLVGLTTPGTFGYAATTAGTWTRIGNTVLLRGRLTLTSVSVAPVGNLTLQGLPITPATVTSGNAGDIACGFWGVISLGGGAFTALGGWIQSAVTNRIDLLRSQNAGGAAAFLTNAIAAVAIGTDIAFQGQYQV